MNSKKNNDDNGIYHILIENRKKQCVHSSEWETGRERERKEKRDQKGRDWSSYTEKCQYYKCKNNVIVIMTLDKITKP